MLNKYLGDNIRSINASKQIIYSFIIKGISIASQFALVPLSLHYLDQIQYGIWLTIASILTWFSIFDLGIGNGLRNKLAESIALNNMTMAKTYVSTAYITISIIFLSILVFAWLINPYINWIQILNIPESFRSEISNLIIILIMFVCFQFILGLISSILLSHQLVAFNNVLFPLANFLSLLLMYVLNFTETKSIFLVGIIFSGVPFIIFLIANIYLFRTRFKIIKPSFAFVDIKSGAKLFGLGLQFFIIQISFLLLFSSSNIIISNFFGVNEVANFTIAFKYYTIGIIINGIIGHTYLSVFTDAFVKKDLSWLNNTIRKLEFYSVILIALTMILMMFSKYVFAIWLGKDVVIPESYKYVMSVYSIIYLVSTPYNVFINSTGKIKLQMYYAISSLIFMLPLSYIFGKTLSFGPSGVIIAMICISIPANILWRVQYKKIISGKASGIWNA